MLLDFAAFAEKRRPDDSLPSADARSTPNGTTNSRTAGGSMFAAGPSTCGDELTGRYHRTVRVPGQGVDDHLLCPAIKKCSPPPYPHTGGEGRGCGKTS